MLATGKNFSHRIYLDGGIYADLTLVYTGGGFQTLPWTYPDYAERGLRAFLEQVRERYRADLKGRHAEPQGKGAHCGGVKIDAEPGAQDR